MIGSATLLREQIQAALGERCDAAFFHKKAPCETLHSVAGDIPRGTLTELAGPASSGRTSLLCGLLAEVSNKQEFCALLDANDAFDPAGAAAAGVRLSQVLWVRCGGNAEHAMKAADLLVHGGGFGLVAIDLGDLPMKTVHRIPLSAWFRLRQAVEKTRTSVIVMARKAHTQSCATVRIEFDSARPSWRGLLLTGLDSAAQYVRNHGRQERTFQILR